MKVMRQSPARNADFATARAHQKMLKMQLIGMAILFTRWRVVSRFFNYLKYTQKLFRDENYIPISFHNSSTRVFIAGSIVIGFPQGRVVSAGHLLVASKPIFPPSPDMGLAKSR